MEPSHLNIVNGIIADEDVNVLEYETVSEHIISQVKQQSLILQFNRKERVRTLADASVIDVAPDRIINPELLFQRCLIVSQSGSMSLEEMLAFELSPFPPSLFKGQNLFRKADKPQLLHVIVDEGQRNTPDILCHNAFRRTDIHVF